MAKSRIPNEYKKPCQKVIHTATVAAAASGAIPIPIADTIPITAAQIAMVIALGNLFGLDISDSVAKGIIACSLAQQTGRTVFTGILKMVPGAGQVVGAVIAATTAASITEALGWIVAEDLYKMSLGENPDSIIDQAPNIKKLFKEK